MAEENKETKEMPEKKESPKEAKETIKNGDFIEIEYIGSLEDGTIFDTTDEGVAKKNNLYNKNSEYGPAIICIGQRNIIKGIDDQLEGKQTRTEYDLKINPEDGFGKKNAKLIQLVSTSKFLKQNINPMPGLQVNIDNNFGIIKNVSGGRALVDFNHPLAGQNLIYKIRVRKLVHDDSEKLKALLSMQLGMPKKDFEITIADKKASVKTKKKIEMPPELGKQFSKGISSLIPSVQEVEFQ